MNLWRFAVALLAAAAAGQERMSLERAASRLSPEFTPAFAGQTVTVGGAVSSKAILVLDYELLPMQDETGYGMFLAGGPGRFAGIEPGERLTVTGRMSSRGGVPVLEPEEVRRGARGAPMTAARVSAESLRGFRRIATLVSLDAEVTMTGENSGGEFLQIGEGIDALRIFLPRPHHDPQNPLSRYVTGDRVRVTGISSQYCPFPPHNRFYQVLISSPASVSMVEPRPPVPPSAAIALGLLTVAALATWWFRERRMVSQRRQMRALHALNEEILAGASPSEILSMLRASVPGIYGVSGVELYVTERGGNQIERVVMGEGTRTAEPVSGGPAICFRNRALLAIPDTERSPFLRGEAERSAYRAAMYVPMFAQKELLGVLELVEKERTRTFTAEEQATAQHLGNQVATALKLLEQQTVREQLFRSERLAAAGRLISAVADEMREPLVSIVTAAAALAARTADENAARQIRTIGEEAQRAAGIVSRLVSISRADQTEARTVDLHGLLLALVEYRSREARQHFIEFAAQLGSSPILLAGARGQLEQAFLNLLVHAEQSIAEGDRRISISATAMAGRAVVEIAYTSSETGSDPFGESPDGDETLGLGICRGIIQGHGGEIRGMRTDDRVRFEVTLPLDSPAQNADVAPAAGARAALSPLTTLLVGTDASLRRRVQGLLVARGHRVVPVSSAEEAGELSSRMRFDVVFCSVRLPGLNWVEFFEQVRRRIRAFVLVTEGHDAELARAFAEGEGYILTAPVEESELDRVLEHVRHNEPSGHRRQ